MPAPKSPELIAAAVAAVRNERSVRSVALEYHVSEGAVRLWCKQAAERAPKEPGGRFRGVSPMVYDADGNTAPAARPPYEETITHDAEQDDRPEAEPTDTLTSARSMLQKMLTLAASAEGVGNVATAQRSLAEASKCAILIARLEKVSAAEETVLRISRQEIAERRAVVRERMRQMCERPLLCAACSRALSVKWGEGEGGSAPAAP